MQIVSPLKHMTLDVGVSPLYPGNPQEMTNCKNVLLDVSEIWGWEGVMSVLLGTRAGRRVLACFHMGPDLSRVGQLGLFHTDFSCRGLGPTS